MSIVRLRPARTGRTRPSFAVAPEENQAQARALRRTRRWAIVGALLGLAFGIVAFLPASLLANAVSDATAGRFQLAEAEGTVWNGTALTVLGGGGGSRDASVLPSRLAWRLRPHWNGLALHLAQDCCLTRGLDVRLLRADGAWQVTVGDATAAPAVVVPRGDAASALASGRATAAADAAAMADQTPVAQWPMGWFEGYGFPWNTIHPGGLLSLTTHGLSFALQDGRWRMHGSAQLELRQFSSRLATLDTLGSYRTLIQADPSTEKTPGEGATRALVWISTLEGALIIDGRGLIGPGGVRLRAEAHAAADAESALNNLLNLIGRRTGALSVISIG